MRRWENSRRLSRQGKPSCRSDRSPAKSNRCILTEVPVTDTQWFDSDTLSEKQRDKLRRAAANRTANRAKAAEWERSLRERALDMASQDVCRNDAASRLARKWRDKHDARAVRSALNDSEAARVLALVVAQTRF